jgi:hypothetical protein
VLNSFAHLTDSCSEGATRLAGRDDPSPDPDWRVDVAKPGTAVQLRNQDGSYADLLIFEIYPRPDLPELEIVSTRPSYLSLLLVAGNGLDRGPGLWWDPNGTSPPGLTPGYTWGGGAHKRWGTNQVELYPQGRVFNTQAFGSYFDAGLLTPEAQAVVGDSGGRDPGVAGIFGPSRRRVDASVIVVTLPRWTGARSSHCSRVARSLRQLAARPRAISRSTGSSSRSARSASGC